MNSEQLELLAKMENVVVTGYDAVKLFPSILSRHTARLIRNEVMETDLKFEGLNYKEMSRYVAMEMDPFDIRYLKLEKIVPVRRFHRGSRPGVTGNEPLAKEADDEVRWRFPAREPTELEKRNLLAAALEIGIRRSFELHTYQFAGKLYQQSEGGPIGMRITGACARIVMGVWSRKVNEILRNEKLEIFQSGGYVDDVRYLTPELEPGRRWDSKQKKFTSKAEWRQDDLENGVSAAKRTSNEIRNAMNSVFWNIQFTSEITEDFNNGRLPTLDFELWVNEKENETTGEDDRGKIYYSFYEKEVSSRFCLMEKSAMAENSKNSTLSQEVIRRMLNTSELLPQGERNQVLEKFISKLEISGYNRAQIKNIIMSGLKGYESKVQRSRKQKTDLHRDAANTAGARNKKKLLGKTNWFKQKKSKKQEGSGNHTWGRRTTKKNNQKNVVAKTVLFIPRTPGGELATLLRGAEEDISKATGDHIKIVEKAGVMLKRMVHKANHYAGEDCERSDCLVCCTGGEESGKSDCRRRNIVYKTFCIQCKEKGRESAYYGESSRTAFERGSEHLRDFSSMAEDSHMWNHQLDEHEGNEGIKFGMKVVRSHTSAFARQVHEAVVIARNQSINLLNAKFEYNRCILPTLAVLMGDREQRDGTKEDLADKFLTEEEEENSIGLSSKSKRRVAEGHEEENQHVNKRRRRWKTETAIKRKNVTTEKNLSASKRRKVEQEKKSKQKAPEINNSPNDASTSPDHEYHLAENLQTNSLDVKSTPSPTAPEYESTQHETRLGKTNLSDKSENFNDILSLFRRRRSKENEKIRGHPLQAQVFQDSNSKTGASQIIGENTSSNTSSKLSQPTIFVFTAAKQKNSARDIGAKSQVNPKPSPVYSKRNLNGTTTKQVKSSRKVIKPPKNYIFKPLTAHFTLTSTKISIKPDSS